MLREHDLNLLPRSRQPFCQFIVAIFIDVESEGFHFFFWFLWIRQNYQLENTSTSWGKSSRCDNAGDDIGYKFNNCCKQSAWCAYSRILLRRFRLCTNLRPAWSLCDFYFMARCNYPGNFLQVSNVQIKNSFRATWHFCCQLSVDSNIN